MNTEHEAKPQSPEEPAPQPAPEFVAFSEAELAELNEEDVEMFRKFRRQ